MAEFGYGFFRRRGGAAASSVAQTIGDAAIGAVGAVGADVEGLVLAGGDDFDGPLNIIGPATPYNKYGTTRGPYLVSGAGQQPRGSTALDGWDSDPFHTGDNDLNRGVKIASMSDTITQSGGRLTLNQRTATAPEKALIGAGRNCLSSMIHTALALHGRPPFGFRWQEQRACTLDSHATAWVQQLDRLASYDDAECDFESASNAGGGGDGRQIQPNANNWSSGSFSTSGGTAFTPDQATTHIGAFVYDASGTVYFWWDGILLRTYTGFQAKVLANAFFFLFSNHCYTSSWRIGTAAPIHLDWLQVWRAPTGTHWTPQVGPVTINVDYNTAFSVTLDPVATVWGSTPTGGDRLLACMSESNEPGGTANGSIYADLPTGITYNSGTRVLSGTLAKPGRLHLARFVTYANGDTGVPQRLCVNVGPHINIAQINATAGSSGSYDLYAQCDAGVLVSDSVGAKAKTISVTGMPSGVSYDDSTGLLSWTSGITAATTGMTVTVTNSIGQQTPATTVDFVAGASGHVAGTGIALPTLTGSPTILFDYDFDKDSSLGLTSGNIDSIADALGGAGPTLSSTGTNRPTQVTRNGLHCGLFARASSQRLTANSIPAGLNSSTAFMLIVIAEPVTVTNSCSFLELAEGLDAFTKNRLHIGGSTSSGYNYRKYDSNAASLQIASVGSAYNAGVHLLIGHSPSHSGNTVPQKCNLNFDGAATALQSASTDAFPVSMAWTQIGCSRQSSAFALFADSRIFRAVGILTNSATNIEEIAVWAAANYGAPNNA